MALTVQHRGYTRASIVAINATGLFGGLYAAVTGLVP